MSRNSRFLSSTIVMILTAMSLTLQAQVPVGPAAQPNQNPAAPQPVADSPEIADAKKRLSEMKQFIHTVAPGRNLFVQYVRPAPGMPTLLSMPGVNRNLLLSEPAGISLVLEGFGVVSFGLSLQPFSIASLATGQKPAFYQDQVTLEYMADEVQSLAAYVQKDLGQKNVIPVSLSYSGAISPFLKGFPLIVETVPMTSTFEVGNGDPATLRASFEFYNNLIPGVSWFNIMKFRFENKETIRQDLNKVYMVQRGQPQAERISKEFNLPADRTQDMAEGYVKMAIASEQFDWRNINTPQESRRVFIIAGNDTPTLVRHQIETYQRVSQVRPQDTLLVIFQNTGHVIPAEKPVAYARILNLIASNQLSSQNGIVIVDPDNLKMNSATGAQADQILNSIIQKLPASQPPLKASGISGK